jgi:hypothetical protein
LSAFTRKTITIRKTTPNKHQTVYNAPAFMTTSSPRS